MSRAAPSPLFIIDASIFIFRYYFSMPSRWFASNGRPTETVYGYALWLQKFLLDQKPLNVVACFDESLGTCFRNEIYPDYKMSRVFPDDDLAFQLLACKKITKILGIQCVASDTYEADDLAGCYAKLAAKRNKPYSILTRDKDLAQLLYKGLGTMWDYPDKAPITETDVESAMGVAPNQVADYLALIGDSSDDIPGIPGVGPKAAQSLLSHFGSWNTLRENIHEISKLSIRGAASLQIKVASHREQVDMALSLTTIATDAMPVNLKETKKKVANIAEAKSFAEELGFSPAFAKNLELLL